MKSFWDNRYAGETFAYGTSPNTFFKNQLADLSLGNLLLPAEGEGRNAIFAALKGWNVIAFDQSEVAKQKAMQLAKQNKVHIEYEVCDQVDFSSKENYFDCFALIFAHMPPDLRRNFHQKMYGFLKPGGTLILEGFEKHQINNTTGGPKNIDMLFSSEELLSDFNSLKNIHLSEEEIILDEGAFHKGLAHVIRLTGIK